MSSVWIRGLLAIVRRTWPQTKIILGGYYYATDAKDFLSMDADVFFVGEGEARYPQVVRRLAEGASLETIPGLYLPRPEGGLRYTGRTEPIDLSTMPAVDWGLSGRIDPPVDIERDKLELGLETQRGCVFKCGFCTFRTLTSPNVMSTEVAAQRILELGAVRYASIMLADATASYPHDRWEALLTELVARGGSPHPIWSYARVSDLPDKTVELMARAGVKQVFIGQESGDQRVLNLMKKGTNIRQMKPAIAALAKHHISAIFAFIHGYPGETPETIQTTRDALLTLNDGHEQRPPVLLYTISPFHLQDMAAAAQSSAVVEDGDHFLDYHFGRFTPELLIDECLTTIMAASRIPHAPAYIGFLGREQSTSYGMILGNHPHPHQVFRWLKAFERGTAIFLEQKLEGKRPDLAELRTIKATLGSYYGEVHRDGGRAAGLRARAKSAIVGRITRELRAEPSQGVGLVTRALAAMTAFEITQQAREVVKAFKTGAIELPKPAHCQGGGIDTDLADMAKIIVSEGIERGRAPLKIVDAQGVVALRRRSAEPPPREGDAPAGPAAAAPALAPPAEIPSP